ncbi:MAG: DUF302 domain-containing protein [Bacteroidales bacterium]
MQYLFKKTLAGRNFDESILYVTETLKTEGFGIISEIDIKKALKDKINVDFRKYIILGACNPHFAYKALTLEEGIGVFLPCNVVVQELENGSIEVMAVDPISMMMSVKNADLETLAQEVKLKLKNVINKL